MVKKASKKGISMFMIIALCLVFISMAASAVFMFTLISKSYHDTNESIDDTLFMATGFVQKTLPDDYHDNLTDENSVSEKKYLEYVAEFDDICLKYDLEYLWTVYKDEQDVVRFTSGTSQYKESHESHAAFYEKHSNQEVYLEVFDSMQPTSLVISDKWGDVRALLIPAATASGKKYIMGASKTAKSVENLLREETYLILILTVGSFIFSVLLALLFSKFITLPIERLVKTMKQREKGKHQAIEEAKGTYEHRQLAMQFNRMSASIQKQINHINQLNQHYDITLESIGDGVITTDKKGCVTRLNLEAQKLTGWSSQDAAGKDFEDIFNIINVKTQRKCINPVKRVLKTGKRIDLANHTVLISKDGLRRSISDSAAPIKDENGTIKGVVLVFRDNSKEQEHLDNIVYISRHDQLTGLYNRHVFEAEKDRLTKANNLPLSVIVGDINGLKLVNDLFGHAQGDLVLKLVADIFKTNLRDKDILARWGGDEFVALMPNTTDIECEQICDLISQTCIHSSEMTINPNISIGYATLINAEQHIDNIHKQAEDMMYQHKLQENNSIRNGIILSLENAIIAKDFQTDQHSQKMESIIKKIAEKANMSKHMMDQLTILARLHDIGKIAIDDAILFKKGKLTSEEWLIVKTHPEIGYRIAKSIPALIHIADGILFHHERWDGKGYPRGLKRKEIPKIARYISIIDSYDAMTTKRPYKKAVTKQEALKEIIRCSKTQFDPELAALFVEIMQENKEEE